MCNFKRAEEKSMKRRASRCSYERSREKGEVRCSLHKETNSLMWGSAMLNDRSVNDPPNTPQPPPWQREKRTGYGWQGNGKQKGQNY